MYDYSTNMRDAVIYENNSKIILPLNANTLRYKTKEDRIGSVAIYDKASKNLEVKENVRRTFFDYENRLFTS